MRSLRPGARLWGLFRQPSRTGRPASLSSPAGRGNINPLDIGFAVRLRLSARLTLIRLALIRKPCPFGGQVSRLPYRYSCLHLLFRRLHRASKRGFGAAGMLPYRYYIPCGFGSALDARLLSMRGRSTSELLRTL
jgi:hypothetical protein